MPKPNNKITLFLITGAFALCLLLSQPVNISAQPSHAECQEGLYQCYILNPYDFIDEFSSWAAYAGGCKAAHDLMCVQPE